MFTISIKLWSHLAFLFRRSALFLKIFQQIFKLFQYWGIFIFLSSMITFQKLCIWSVILQKYYIQIILMNIICNLYVKYAPKDVIFRRLFSVCIHRWLEHHEFWWRRTCFHVAVSLAACIYFFNAKAWSLARASIIVPGALASGWILGSIVFQMIPTVLT